MFVTDFFDHVGKRKRLHKKAEIIFKIYVVTDLTKSTQPAFTCPNLTIETIKQGVKYVQS